MADLSNPLTQVVVGQAQPAVTVNNVVDALSPAACFGQNDLTTTGLTWGYYGGRFNGIAIAHGTIALPASQATIYIVANKSTGVVSQSTSNTNWNDSTNYQRLHIATTGVSTITDWDDYREFIASGLGGGSATWGAISGTLSSQSDLQSALDNKVPANTFEEQVQDIVATLITAGTNVTKQYNDGDSPATLVINSTASGTSLTQEDVEDIVAALITPGTNVTKQYNDGDSPATLVINSTASGGGSLTQEEVEDIVASLITAGTNVTKQYNDGDSPATLVISATGGAALTHFTESVNTSAPNATVPVVQLLATNAATDVEIALTPKGAAGISMQIADNTTAGGNKRGNRAIDLQSSARSNANQVASGIDSVVIGGLQNRASADRSAVIGGQTGLASSTGAFVAAGSGNTASQTSSFASGNSNTASGVNSFIAGGNTNAASATDAFAHGNESLADALYSRSGGFGGTTRGVIGADAWGAGYFNARGDYNTRRFVLRQRTTDATATRMTTNGSGAATTNQVTCVSSGAVFITGHAIVSQATTGDTGTWTFNACINNIAGTTALVGAATVTAGPASAGAATWTLGITADDTNDSFAFTATGEAAHTLLWVAFVQSVEKGPG